MTAANEADILRAVERWARVRGWTGGRWLLEESKGWGFFFVAPAIALAWALLVETGSEPVDVGRCPTCRGRGEWSWWDRGWRPEFAAWAVQDGEIGEVRVVRTGGPWPLGTRLRNELDGFPDERRRAVSGPCPACTGTGREHIPAERLLLDAAPRKFDTSSPLAVYGERAVFNGIEQANDMARDRLLAHSDKLQANGDPIGDLLAWALRLWAGEPTDCGECSDCKGRGVVPGDPPSWANPYGEPPEDCGCVAGRQLGHPHTADAVRWLEWLTWAREFERERADQPRIAGVGYGTEDWLRDLVAAERWG